MFCLFILHGWYHVISLLILYHYVYDTWKIDLYSVFDPVWTVQVKWGYLVLFKWDSFAKIENL